MKRHHLWSVLLLALMGTGACSSHYRTEFEEIGGDQWARNVPSKAPVPYGLAINDISMNRPYSGELVNELKAKIESAHVFKKVELGSGKEREDFVDARVTIFDTRLDRRGLRSLEDADHPEAYEGAFIEHRYQMIVHWPKGHVGIYEAKCGGLLEGHGPLDLESQQYLQREADHCLNALVNKLMFDLPKMLGSS